MSRQKIKQPRYVFLDQWLGFYLHGDQVTP